ncbi:hypothetical protein ACHAWT_009274 [Skeletonema menzelii]
MTPLRRQNLVSSSVAALFIVVATTIIGIVIDGRSSSSQVYYYSHIDDSRQLSISADASFLGDPRTVTLKTPANDGRTTLDSAAVDTKIKITETLTYTDIINNAAPLPQYDLSSAVQAANMYSSRFALLRYDPSTDRFVGYYSNKQPWVSGCRKLAEAVRITTIMLRDIFPQRFTKDSPELVMAISGGDYPAVDTTKYGSCVFKNEEAPCDESLLLQAPILHFGSVFNHPLFPNMIGMPMPTSHTNCFVNWLTQNRQPCNLFRPIPSENTLPWDELTPQLVWRGTDFRFLSFQNDLERPSFEKYVEGKANPNANLNKSATTILRQNIQKLIPRWKGVVFTAEAEIEATRTKTPAKINIKFADVAEGGKHPAIGAKEYKKWEEIGFPVAGEHMNEDVLSKFKYHIDIGGGGGTTWTGTVRKLGMPGLLFHHVTPTKDYIHDQIKPWVHYVPVQLDLSDLKEKLEWAETHQDEAKRISDNATALMKFLSSSVGFEPLFEQHMLNPLLAVIQAYKPMNLGDEKSWKDAFWQLGGDDFSPFMECSTSCQVYDRPKREVS